MIKLRLVLWNCCSRSGENPGRHYRLCITTTTTALSMFFFDSVRWFHLAFVKMQPGPPKFSQCISNGIADAGRMPFQSPNQQCSKQWTDRDRIAIKIYKVLSYVDMDYCFRSDDKHVDRAPEHRGHVCFMLHAVDGCCPGRRHSYVTWQHLWPVRLSYVAYKTAALESSGHFYIRNTSYSMGSLRCNQLSSLVQSK